MQADCSATAQSLETEVEARQAELVDVRAEQQAREAQAAELDRQIAESERRLQVRLMLTVALLGRACMSNDPLLKMLQPTPSILAKHGNLSAISSHRLHPCQAIHPSKGSATTTGMLIC